MKLTLQEAERMMAENNGSLDIRYDTRYTELPEGLTVDGNLDISYTGLRELPENLTVGGGLYMEHTKIKKLPEGLTVGGWLDAMGSEIKELPEGLIVGEALDISDTEIKELPEGLMVGGWLDVRGSEIRKLPERLTVGGSLYMKGTEITELPESLVVGGYIYWDGKTCKSPTSLRQGDYAPGRYQFADGILTQISQKKAFGDMMSMSARSKGGMSSLTALIMPIATRSGMELRTCSLRRRKPVEQSSTEVCRWTAN